WEADDWRGNVRELRNTIARHLATDGLGSESSQAVPHGNESTPEIEALLLSAQEELRVLLWSQEPIPLARVKLLESYQKARVQRALVEHAGAVDAAAKSLGIGKRYLHMLKSGPRRR